MARAAAARGGLQGPEENTTRGQRLAFEDGRGPAKKKNKKGLPDEFAGLKKGFLK